MWPATGLIALLVAGAGAAPCNSSGAAFDSDSDSHLAARDLAPRAVSASSWAYLGCVTDDGTRLLATQVYSGSLNSQDYCVNACASAGYKYAGTQCELQFKIQSRWWLCGLRWQLWSHFSVVTPGCCRFDADVGTTSSDLCARSVSKSSAGAITTPDPFEANWARMSMSMAKDQQRLRRLLAVCCTPRTESRIQGVVVCVATLVGWAGLDWTLDSGLDLEFMTRTKEQRTRRTLFSYQS
jgi:hypothetical protein